MGIHFWGDERDALVNESPLAFLIAMLLDQQVPLSWAFDGPNRIAARLADADDVQTDPGHGQLDAAALASMEPDDFAAIAAEKPAIHRYHRSMAGRIQALCAHIVETWDNDAGAIWDDGATASVVAERLAALPGFGPEKVKITIAALVKRFDVDLVGWENVAAPFSDAEPRSVADVADPERFEAVKAWKKQQKAAGLDKQDAPL